VDYLIACAPLRTAILGIAFDDVCARYHIYTATMACLGFAGIICLHSGREWIHAGWRGGALSPLMSVSPAFLFLKNFAKTIVSSRFMPIRLGVLIPLRRRPSYVVSSSYSIWRWRSMVWTAKGPPCIASAGGRPKRALIAHNFYGATGLAIFYLVLVCAYFWPNVTASSWPGQSQLRP